jgi:hypothetical protein
MTTELLLSRGGCAPAPAPAPACGSFNYIPKLKTSPLVNVAI